MGRRDRHSDEGDASPVRDYFYVYPDLPWEDIERYLNSRFAGWSDYKARRSNDKWLFYIPRALTTHERQDLREIRDRNKRARGDSESP